MSNPADFGFTNPSDEQVILTIQRVVHSEFNGEQAILERTSSGNLGAELRHVCKLIRVIIPGPVRFRRLLQVALGDNWTVNHIDLYRTEVFAIDEMDS